MKNLNEKKVDTKTKIPPLAHFIWAGGTKLLPKEGIENISQWIEKNKDIIGFEATLWVDKKTAPKDMIETYKELFKERNITVFTEKEFKTKDRKEVALLRLILKDIGENSLRNEYVAYEIDKLRPNYGSSSDLLRYEILYRFGGFYCDCTDVKPGKDGLALIFDKEFAKKNVMYLEHCPQNPNSKKEDLEKFTINRIGNDTFLTNKHNDAISKILSSAHEKYNLLTDNLSSIHIVSAHSGNNIKDTTIERTGPDLVRRVLTEKLQCRENGGKLIDANGLNEFYRFRDGSLELVIPGSNTGNWLNTRITKYDDKQIALSKVFKTMNFEAKYFKVLRLDDHIKDLIDSTSNSITQKNALEKLMPVMQENKEKIKYTQLTGEFGHTIDYVLNAKLISVFNLQSDFVVMAITSQCYLIDFIKAEQTADQLKNNKEISDQARSKNLSVTGLILASQRPEVIHQLCQQMIVGIRYMQYFSQRLEVYEKKAESSDYNKVIDFLIDRLKKYEEYSGILNEKIEKNYKVDVSEIHGILESLLPIKQNEIKESNKMKS